MYLYLGKYGDGYFWVLKRKYLYVRERATRRSRYVGRILTLLSFGRGGPASFGRAASAMSGTRVREAVRLLEALKRLVFGMAIDLEMRYTWNVAKKNREATTAGNLLFEMGIGGQPFEMLYSGLERAIKELKEVSM